MNKETDQGNELLEKIKKVLVSGSKFSLLCLLLAIPIALLVSNYDPLLPDKLVNSFAALSSVIIVGGISWGLKLIGGKK